jgi:hypothetical protein
MLYEMATIALGVWVVWLQLRLNRKSELVNKLSQSLDCIADGTWKVVLIDDGFEVIDKSDNERMIAVRRVKR